MKAIKMGKLADLEAELIYDAIFLDVCAVFDRIEPGMLLFPDWWDLLFDPLRSVDMEIELTIENKYEIRSS